MGAVRTSNVALWPRKESWPRPVPRLPARDALDAAIKAAPRPVPCMNPAVAHLWLSDDHGDSAAAAARCGGCPVWAVCADYAAVTQPTAGVYAGRRHTQTREGGR